LRLARLVLVLFGTASGRELRVRFISGLSTGFTQVPTAKAAELGDGESVKVDAAHLASLKEKATLAEKAVLDAILSTCSLVQRVHGVASSTCTAIKSDVSKKAGKKAAAVAKKSRPGMSEAQKRKGMRRSKVEY
jgi:hypothetical protein